VPALVDTLAKALAQHENIGKAAQEATAQVYDQSTTQQTGPAK
jgi:hypothetical protein